MLEYEGKMITRSRALVIDNRDPLKKGRIRVKHPILGETVWINFIKDEGSFGVPSIGEIVYLECDCGYETHPIAHGKIPKGTDTDINVPDIFRRLNPTNRGFYTPSGHTIEMDDGEGIAKLGKGIRITTKNGIKIDLDDDTDKVTVTTVNEDLIELSSLSGIKIESKLDVISTSKLASNTVEAGSSDKLVLELGSATLSSSNTKLELSPAEAKLSEPIGASLSLSMGKVKLGTDAAELVTILETSIKALTDNASAFVLTNVGPGQLSPAVVAILQQMLLLIGTIKA